MPLRRSSRNRTPPKAYVVPGSDDEDENGVEDSQIKRGRKKIKKETTKTNVKVESDPPDSDDESFQEDVETNNDNDAQVESSEEDEEIIKPKNSRRKRGRSSEPRSRSKSKSAKKKRDYGPSSERTCPFCGKIFSIITGLAYHIEHRVCQRPTEPISISAVGSVPFPVLEQGERFVTTFGVVSVLGDNRVPDDYGKTKITKELRKAKTYYTKKKDRLITKKGKLNLYMTKLSRKRRETLLELWNDRYGDGNAKIDAKIFAEKTFKVYCPSSTAKELLSDGDDTKVKIPLQKPLQPIPDIGPNPAFPADCYPNRIVKCVLVKDKRKRVWDTDEVLDGRWSHVDSAIALVEKVQKKSKTKKKKLEKVKNDDEDNIDESGMTIFIRRMDLIHRYNPESPVYICKYCGKEFFSRVGCKNHLDEKICFRQSEQFEEDRQRRLQQVEAALDSVVRAPPSLVPPPPPLPPGQKKRKNAHKLPGWIVFHPNKSVMYPEVFTSLKFKRGSNNTKFMHKKWGDMGPGRKKIRKSRAKKATNTVTSELNEVDTLMDCSNQPMYPAVSAALFPTTTEERKPSRRAASRRAKEKVSVQIEEIGDDCNVMKMDEEYNPEDDQLGFLPEDMDIEAPMPPLPMPTMPALPITKPSTTENEEPPKVYKHQVTTADTGNSNMNITVDTKKQADTADKNQEQTTTPKKRRRRKKSTSPTVPKPFNPIIVDICPLVEEVNAGRYPSMKAYHGEHLDICFLCKTQDKNVLHCEFCANSEHLTCLQSKVKILDPEPDDPFMCHRCVQTVLARRARAEKRRISKLNDALKAGGNDNNVSCEVADTITSPIEHAKIAAKRKREIVWSQSEFDAHVATYSNCPTGGPGGLICCRQCTASYSNLLNDTAKEMESQTVSSVGREVSELIELLHDAQIRLKQAVDVSNGNDVRRNILNPEEAGSNDDESRGNKNGKGLMGIMDIFSK